jgi:DtxR family Mn-dependent transcriptional regulator
MEEVAEKLPESQEDYLKAIYLISKQNHGGWVSNSEIADFLNIKPSSVTNMLYKLKELELIDWSPRKSMRLTSKGKHIGKQIFERYEVLKDFFVNVLNLSEEEVSIEEICCKIEHHLNREVSKALFNFNETHA